MKTEPNDKAHPYINKNGDAEQGLTKREYFAAMAMQGLLSTSLKTTKISDIASDAVLMADALIDELNK